ncbi:insulinase family protein [Alteromonas sp. ASW11-130]|uniref:insulinase family protein n=1 Tax=Alteromonas sp. ASW11-130 TaxID=3015775 RepID=UPI00224193A8|nr:insulinase family protein [Alteromonas sp. ASW11-130]MCW8093041.1 insulinase family protein [Alteromonas sp. ASW11-130]
MTTPPDKDRYHFLTLENGLKVMIYHQPQQAASYVSMAIRGGHFYDPQDCQGLSHLLEHMLFMGSVHLPNPNQVNEYIENHGGSMNAWTGAEYANFHFNCRSEALPSVLPAFADMLSSPLLAPDSIEREINTIESEFQFKLKDDLRRLYQIHKETCNPDHPFSKFSVGNADIFNRFETTALKAKLKAFHQHHYCASNMGLCIVSPAPPEAIKELVSHSFSTLPAGQPVSAEWPALYTAKQTGVQINIVPLQAAKRMIVTFALPGLHNEYKTKPLDYLSHLLGDEGEGSLLAVLKRKNWVMNLIAGSGIEGDDFKDFNLSFQLTPLGLENRDAIIAHLFAYLELIKSSLNESWRYQEKAKLNRLANEFDDNPKLLNAACDYAQALLFFNYDAIPQLKCLSDKFNPQKVEYALRFFNVENMRVKVIDQALPTNRTSEYYHAKYSVSSLSDDSRNEYFKHETDDALTLPPPNPYLGEDYSLIDVESKYLTPQLLTPDQNKKIWFAQDEQFVTPKGDIFISFDVPGFTDEIRSVAAKRVWLAAINDYLQAKYYRAEIAGLHYRVYGHQAGFSVNTRGFSQNQMKLCQQILETILKFTPPKDSFSRLQHSQLQSLHNSLMNKPTNRLFSRLSVLSQRNTHAPLALFNAVQELSYEEMVEIKDNAFSSYFLEGLVFGNWRSEEAKEFTHSLNTLFSESNESAIPRAVAQLPVGAPSYHEVICEHDDAAIVLYLQAPSSSLIDTAMCMILEQMLAAPFFNVLRSEKQLGYVVGTGYVPHNQHPGFAFYIQSPSFGPEYLLSEVRSFIKRQFDEINFYRAYWPTIQKNLLKQLEEKDLSQSMKAQRLWLALGNGDNTFSRNAQLAQQIHSLTFNEIKQYADAAANREKFGELILYAPGKFEGLSGDFTHIADITEFKQKTPYFDKGN